MNEVRYEVTGQLLDVRTQRPMADYSVITETGIRDEGSPLCVIGIGVKDRRTDPDGRFQSTFFAKGSSVPTEIEVHIQFSPGSWRCREVPVEPNAVQTKGDGTVSVDLGRIEVDYDLCRLPTGDE